MVNRVLISLLSILLSLLTLFVSSQKNVYYTMKVKGEPPAVNGQPDDSVWDQVPWAGRFIQMQPYENKSPSQPTFFKILYDDDNLYVLVMVRDTTPEEIARRLSRRDGMEGDLVGIMLDSYHDQRTAFCFVVSAAAVKSDYMMTDDGNNEDNTWDPVWYAKTSVTDSGWIAEMRIPFTQLRFSRKGDQVWGLNVVRVLFRKQETSAWQFIPQDAPGSVHLFGELKGITGIKPKRQVEVTPYVVASEKLYGKEESNPFSKGSEMKLSGGLDGKIGVTNDLTLDYTVNPDFGQVESDPSEVNLTAFETYFQEKRPFFIEGKNIFDFSFIPGDSPSSSDRLFYSRRIGRPPQYCPDLSDDEYILMPDKTTIWGALKLAGKSRKGLSLGIMESVASREVAEMDSEETRKKMEVEPLTNYFAGRIQKDFNKGNTILGGMLTATNRRITNAGIDFLPDAAYVAGVDFQHFWKEKVYYIRVKGVVSHICGDTVAMTNIQRSPVHYFQRPGASYIDVDSSRHALTGQGGTIELGKTGGGHLSALAWVSWRSPSFELNDMGFLRNTDDIFQVLWMGYRIWEPFSIFRSININMNQWTGWDFGGTSTYFGGNINFSIQFKNYWYVSGGINFDGPSLLRTELRGGPYLTYPDVGSTWWSVASDDRKKVSLGGQFLYAWAPINKDIYESITVDFIVRPSDAVKLTASPFISFNKTHLQYVETCTYDSQDRYIMGYIDQTTAGLTVRFDLNITPDITLQYYGQPFISAGNYTAFKRITDPQAKNYMDRYHGFTDHEIAYNGNDEIYSVDENLDGIADYSFDDPNFNFKQFRSNMVFRWEYVPGSTLYFVWSQERTGCDVNGRFYFNGDFNNLFALHPCDIFLIKLSYRIAI
jgi:hypothetical protein